MNIHLAGSRPTRLAPKEYFTGTVWQDPIIAAEAPARIVIGKALPPQPELTASLEFAVLVFQLERPEFPGGFFGIGRVNADHRVNVRMVLGKIDSAPAALD